MYTIARKQEKGLDYLELKCSKGHSEARICLDQGTRIDKLRFNAIEVISEIDSLAYNFNYASAILFPFANRIKKGKYVFSNLNYELDCNEVDRDNALHGLVYNKTFTYVEEQLTSDFASVKLCYEDEGKSKGFPFKYRMELTYNLSKNGLSLSVNILNTDDKVFPFTLGWHPYFKSENLYNSSLNFKSKNLFQVDEHQIPIGKIAFNETMPFQLKDKKLDTGYKLEDNQVEFLTPDYHLKIESTSKDNYLQLYTPSSSNSIAIEPMTGATDSFNNQIGLQTLHPNTNYIVEWAITFKDLTT